MVVADRLAMRMKRFKHVDSGTRFGVVARRTEKEVARAGHAEREPRLASFPG